MHIQNSVRKAEGFVQCICLQTAWPDDRTLIFYKNLRCLLIFRGGSASASCIFIKYHIKPSVLICD